MNETRKILGEPIHPHIGDLRARAGRSMATPRP